MKAKEFLQELKWHLERIIRCSKHNNKSKLKGVNKTISINLGGFFFHIDEDALSKIIALF